MHGSRGRFVWYELMTTDPAAARAFYASVVGWRVEDSHMPGMDYTLLYAGDTQLAGMAALPEEARRMGVPPHWLGYVAVDDVDAFTDRATRMGAAVHVPPMDIPGVGRFSIVADPQGASIALFRGASDSSGPQAEPNAPGHVGWHELYASDWEKALGFYAELVGWGKGETMDMGEMGVYQLFSNGDRTVGGMFNKPPMVPMCFWLYYFNVGDIDAAASRVTENGGTVMMGPHEVPGGGWIVQCSDPQGAMFALVGRRG